MQDVRDALETLIKDHFRRDWFKGEGDRGRMVFYDEDAQEIPFDVASARWPEDGSIKAGHGQYAILMVSTRGEGSVNYDLSAPDWRMRAYAVNTPRGGEPEVVIETLTTSDGALRFASGVCVTV